MKMKKKIYYEWMRIIACGLVIFNHVDAYGLYMNSVGIKQGIYMVLTMITRINVPLFFMISGALLLEKEEDFITIIRKRISRICLVIFLFELGIYMEYYIYGLIHGEYYNLSGRYFIDKLLSEGLAGAGSYWYLYSYLSFLFMLPFLQKAAKDIQKQDICVLLFLHFLFSSFIPMMNIILEITGNRGIKITGNFFVPFATTKAFFYPLLGWYLEYHIDIRSLSKKKIRNLCIAAAIGIFLSCLCTLYEGKSTGSYTQNYVQLFDYLTSISSFIIIKYMVEVFIPQLSEGMISEAVYRMGSLTFGIYLLDPYLKLIFYQRYKIFMGQYFPTLFVSIGWCILSMTMGGTITFFLKRLPVLEKLL